MIKQHIILALSWILFCFLHSFFAGISFKKKVHSQLKSHFKYYRLYYTLFAFLSFAAILFYQVRLASPLVYRPTILMRLVGSSVLLAGLTLMLLCIRKYFAQLSGLKTMFIDEVKSGNHLIITGIHRHVRHPLYLGTFLFIWGLFIFFPLASLLVSNIIITIYTLIGIGFEEDKLVEEFGDSYKVYQKSVPKIIPLLKAKEIS